MLVLLPPSESKAAPLDLSSPGPLDLAALSRPDLAAAREEMLAALLDASGRQDATTLLGVPPGVSDAVAANLDIPTSRVGPAGSVYRGVLYDAADMAGLLAQPRTREVLGSDVLVFSALYGAVAATDLIAPYRMNMGARPPLLGRTPAAFWRGPLAAALDERAEGDVVVDARSSSYQAAWKVPAATDHVTVRVEREVGGRRGVVSHSAKHLRGVLTGHLVRREGPTPTRAEEVLAAARELLGAPVGTPRTPLTLVAAELRAGAGPDQLVLVTR